MSFGNSKPYLFASGALLTWACATANDPDVGTRPDEPVAGRGGSAGSVAQNGGGGSSGQSGNAGSTVVSGGSSGTGKGGVGGVGTSGGRGGSGGVGGNALGGGGAATAGSSGSSGASGAGGSGGNAFGGANTTGGGGNAAGGVSGTGGNTSGGTGGGSGSGGKGTGGIPNDPNWMPPDMEATADLLVLYHPDQTAVSSRDVKWTLTLKNQTDTPYDLSGVTIRYWMSAEPAPELHVYYSSTGLRLTGMGRFVGNMSNSYVEYSFGTGGKVPAYVDQNSLNEGQIKGGVDTTINNQNFDQSDDWSFDRSVMGGTEPNPKITVYDGDTLIWGCEPSHVCASAGPSGEAGAGG